MKQNPHDVLLPGLFHPGSSAHESGRRERITGEDIIVHRYRRPLS